MYIVFNELSIDLDISEEFTKEKAREIINKFIDVLRKIKQRYRLDGLITTHDIFSFKVSSEYSINDWLSDPLVNKTYKDFLRILYNQKCSYIDNKNYDLNEFEINIEGYKFIGIGCLVASNTDKNVVSLQTHELWINEIISGVLSSLDDEMDKIITKDIQLNNISEEAHCLRLEDKLKKTAFDNLSSGQDLWEKRELLFPNLIFCESVKEQLYKDPQKFHIEQIAKKLFRIQEYFSEYDGVYHPKKLGLDARSESETVKSNESLRAMRYFKKTDGSNDYFYDHIGFMGNYCGRIHFLPDDENRKCYIGYIGRHLKTKKY
ncbi:hypothetical protein ACF3M2_14205 [Tissierella carlieri]|uniref:hypothetical protein n=1 Tax=Tissierella carlieri TaxID=689904 RepID=UPI00386A7A99